MSIRFSQWSDTGRFITPHFTRHTTSEGLEFYVLSGVVIVGLRATEDGDWLRERLEFGLLLPELPAGKALRLKHWAPFVTINAVQNGDAGHQGGHAVDAFGMLFSRQTARGPLPIWPSRTGPQRCTVSGTTSLCWANSSTGRTRMTRPDH